MTRLLRFQPIGMRDLMALTSLLTACALAFIYPEREGLYTGFLAFAGGLLADRSHGRVTDPDPRP